MDDQSRFDYRDEQVVNVWEILASQRTFELAVAHWAVGEEMKRG